MGDSIKLMQNPSSPPPHPIGQEMVSWAKDLFPLNRSLMGEGVRDTLNYLKEILPELEINEVPSGTIAFDWLVPKEWRITDAYIICPNGEKIAEFKKNNLHVMGYSNAVNKKLSLDELDKHFYSLPNMPDAIPYVTSYYDEGWAFCISHAMREDLEPGEYHVVIESEKIEGSLTYGELLIPGREQAEVLFSTYVCHPSLANNELSGPVLTAALARWIGKEQRKFSYRIIFVPETIGAIVYLSRNLDALKDHLIAGYVVSCVGDERRYSYMPSREGNTYADKVALAVLENNVDSFDHYSFLERGSDERQYCSPNIDLPVCSIMRSKYGTYPEYHTSLDNFDVVTGEGLAGSYEIYKKVIELIEFNDCYAATNFGEPQLGKRGLYPLMGTNKSKDELIKNLWDILAYADGIRDVIDIAKTCNITISDTIKCINILQKHELLKLVE